MTKKIILLFAALFAAHVSAQKSKQSAQAPFVWEGTNLYFLMTDRFNNGDKSNDVVLNRTRETAKLRGFEGGDLRGIIQKIDEGYFDKLGVNVIWFTPVVEQIHDGTDEGTGVTYGFHGYWAHDWTRLDPNFGTEADLAELVTKAHAKGIRIMLDGVINHTGPETPNDASWPQDWVRTTPQCDYKTYDSTTACTLVKNLPDIRTESNALVEIPKFLADKWKAEGRYEKEMKELDEFFTRTGYPRAPKYYIIKWLTDYILDFGIDGYRADTVKHLGEDVWADFKRQCEFSFGRWKRKNPEKVLDSNPFYTIAEVYNYGINAGREFDFGDKKVNYYSNGFNALINFEFKWNAKDSYEALFSMYSDRLNTILEGNSVLNYLSSHDDGQPFDANREKPFESATKLLLSPGIAQIYYGDESARSLAIPGAEGDAKLRSFMNWSDIQSDAKTKKILAHWQKLGQFRKNHPAIGAGVHQQISSAPYVFSRGYRNGKFLDRVVVGLDLPKGKKELNVSSVFKEGAQLYDAYSGQMTTVINGRVTIDSDFDIVLLEKI
ncbi:Alpha-amylase [Flavobacterium longum]|uniref:alpha-amylase family glycosyl hydrolase n=1 Tax=Flavobacterium longum TaxID=1299340 RepID=UPI0039EC84EF